MQFIAVTKDIPVLPMFVCAELMVNKMALRLLFL
jgi:hypothetical protein